MISDLHLVNVRSYADKTFTFAPLTVIVGPNGIGKTNIIEALFFLSTGRSFRTHLDRDVIQFGQPFARMVSGALDIVLTAKERVQKQLRIHGKSARLLDLLGVQPSVLFTPTSLSLIDGAPAIRRQYIDILLSQTDSHYARALLQFQRTLRQRNELLHQITEGLAKADDLPLWDDLLVEASIPVLQARKQMVADMREQLGQWYRAISTHNHDAIEVVYASSVDKRGEVSQSELDLTTLYHERLRERRVAEVQAGRTLIGPHRDDMHVLLQQKPIADFGSRGEMRSAVVALKLFEYSYMKERGEVEPTLLFDDVFSEFDPSRRKAILQVLPGAQMIFTATDLKHIGTLPSHAEVIDLTQLTP